MPYEVANDLYEGYGLEEATDILDLPALYGQDDEESPAQGVMAWAEKANNPEYAGWFAGAVAAWEVLLRQNQDPMSILARVAIAYGGYRLATGVLAEGTTAFNDREQWLSIALIAGGVGYCMTQGRANIYEL